jgi:two-component system, NarL family, nitrate/nitrite response regulator NarL
VDSHRVRVLLLDDDRGVAQGMQVALAGRGIHVVGIEPSLAGILARVVVDHPDVVVADIDIAGELAFGLPAALGDEGPPILWWSGHGERYREQAYQAGGAGFVGKREGLDELVKAILSVADGGQEWRQKDTRAARTAPKRPSPREMEVLEAAATGRRDKEIGYDLGIADRTVQSHLLRMRNRYGVGNRVELIDVARRRGWIR